MYSPQTGDCKNAAAEEKKKKRSRKTGNDSSESEALQIMSQFDDLYKCRIAEIESDNVVSDARRNELKLKIMNDWVQDLRDQNAMLVQTVHDLEKAAVCRVKLLEGKLQETSLNISNDILNSDKSEDDLKQLSGRVHTLVDNQIDLECRIKNLQCDIDSLLDLIKRGRLENNWSLDGITFYEIEPSDIPEPTDCSCDQIMGKLENEENECCDNLLDPNTLRMQYECKISSLQNYYENKCKMAEARVECLEKEACETRIALAEEVAHKHDEVLALKNRKSELKQQLCDSDTKNRFKDEIIEELRKELKQAKQVPRPIKKVKMNVDFCEQLEPNITGTRMFETKPDLEDLNHILDLKNDEINKLKQIISEQAKLLAKKDECSNSSLVNQDEIISYLSNLVASMEKDNEHILSLKLEYETVSKNLHQTKHVYENQLVLINEKLMDIETCLQNYRKDVIEQVSSTDNTKEFISSIERKITCIKNMFQNKCEICVKENLLSGFTEISSQIKSSIQALSKIYEKESRIVLSIKNMISKNTVSHNTNFINENEQKAIFEAIMQQFRMMEEFRICTVEVQAATEDLHEEVSAVVSNLKMQHRKYVELAKMINQVQDYFVNTKESINAVINRLELQDQEKSRNNQRLKNNRIRLKDIKNEFNQNQSALSKCLNNVHNSIQQSNPLGYTEIYNCNDLLISVIEEVEQITCNLQTVKSQDSCILSSVKELNKQLATVELNVGELKKKIDTVLLENETAQKKFKEKSKRLEKYEAEVDNSHTKMQDVLESIIAIRDQMNEFGCIKESEICLESTDEIMIMKNDLRRLQKEYEDLKTQLMNETCQEVQNKTVSAVESKNVELHDKIKVLQSELKNKQDANIFLQQNLELLEKEIHSTRTKADECRKFSSLECLNLKKRILELENSIKVQKNTENSVKCLQKNKTDTKKLQLLDYDNVPQLLIVLQDTIYAIKSGLVELSDNLKRLVSEGSTRENYSKHSIWTAIELLKKYVENIKLCSFEVEKIKSILYSKDKLMENMNEIIEIQKDSISISQSEVEDLHKKLQEKIEAQEKIISQSEKEKRKLNKQIELQVQTIGHLQTAVVEAKKTIDQLNNKATSDNFDMNQKIRSLNVYLTEVENQYSDCFGEASKQDILLELQRETIAKLKNQIKFLKCDAFLNAFMLHFIYYFVLYKYKEEVKIQNSKVHDLELKMKDLVCMNNNYEERYGKLDFKYQESNKKVEILRSSFEESRQTSAKMQCEIERLTLENTDLKKRLQVYKLDFNLIEEEMKKMGIIDPSMESLKIEVEGLRSENDKFKFNAECYEKTLKDLKFSNKCLSKKLSDIKYSRDTSLEKYNERIAGHQIEINIRNAKIKNLNNQIKYNKKEIIDQSQTIEDLKNKLCENEHRITNYSADLNSAKERIKNLQSHINKLQRILDEKSYRMEKLEDDNKILKNNSEFEKTELRMANEKSKNEKCLLELKFEKAERKLIDLQKNYDKALHDLNKKNQCLCSLGIKRCALLKYEANNPEKINHDEENEIHLKNIKSEEVIEKLRKDLEDTREKLAAKNDEFAAVQTKLNAVSSKYDSAERNCQRQKDELMLLEKKLTCINQKFQNCTDKNVELIRQNKLLEENYNKCITELEDIMLQLEDMQSSLVELRNECDAKTKSLDDVSTELDKMRVSRSEVCEESQYVLQWVRLWMHKQKQTNFILQNKLDEKHRQLLVVNAEKRNNMITTKRLKRKNKILAKRLKIIRKPILKPACIITNGYPEISEPIEKFITLRQGNLNSFNSYKNKSNAIYCLFRRERKKKSDPIDIVTTHGDCKWFRNLGYLSKQLPKSSQIRGSNRPERKISEETTDYGYQTSSSK